ncbi:MAG: RNase adapter RapZ [Deltaproteobacteria bacterium]|nr:RNase adapter RapZ [Deltaproteobacteria bacterium]MBW2052165.1 RNase adapter RapZ [Deltaproteobacteria bacterium]MBW2139673.1 RNase adapter RapZ [Deltaproteobacteria bacterium]MBW2322285.1 RNase adapter RapZ [Deltaproteobacteria bacterium]
MDQRRGNIIIITGLSGSGKTTALAALEDQGFFCIDNLPVLLLPKFLSLYNQTSTDFLKLAVVMDMREKNFVPNFQEIFIQIQSDNYDLKMIFLEASSDILLRNFSYTRRPHPLAQEGKLLEAIERERRVMVPVKEAANQVVDTSDFNVHQLRDFVSQKFAKTNGGMSIELLSFGYRYGLPQEADIVMDVRFLSNPYYHDELRELDGRDLKVVNYVMASNESRRFVSMFYDLLKQLIPLYETEGKSYLTIAIGCSGGRHRSVTISNELARRFEGKPYRISVRHRDLNQGIKL